jgi:hypothetical protein
MDSFMQLGAAATATTKKSTGGCNSGTWEIVLELSDDSKRIIGVIKDHGLKKHITVNIHINKFKGHTGIAGPYYAGTKLDHPTGMRPIVMQLKFTDFTCLERTFSLNGHSPHTQIAHLLETLFSVMDGQPGTTIKRNSGKTAPFLMQQ